jgi:hypothetical protein
MWCCSSSTGWRCNYSRHPQRKHILKLTSKVTKRKLSSDTGCDRSVCPRRMVPMAKLHDASLELWAANGRKIPVLGSMQLLFTVNGIPLTADLLVSDDVDELILGYDWLATNGCQRHFDKATIITKGNTVRLKHRPARASVRRVYVSETTIVDANTRAKVPIHLSYANLRSPAADWLVEPKRSSPWIYCRSYTSVKRW